ncbi:thioredoxin family protein [uncultured Draconibacterium sp.]|uniref:thioredoxin family protein n=1 Tax=uncultured Draconibacterium sp. TaxID=1573823 RepID=UPI0025D97ACA|nr:thioredoxin family protein [uncultured Draconibacterium sp.]
MVAKQVLFLGLFLVCSQLNAQVWLHDFDQACLMAQNENKLLLIDFYADWCEPCKRMDRETWSQDAIKAEMTKVIAVKVNIDDHKSLATRYSIKAIPDVLIADAWGGELYELKGYKSASQMLAILETLPNGTGELNNLLKNLQENSKDAELNLLTGKYYQQLSKDLEGKGQSVFLRISLNYFVKANKYFGKANEPVKQEEIELLKSYNLVLAGRAKKVVSDFEKSGFDQLHVKNRALAYFIACSAYVSENDAVNAKLIYEKISLEKDSEEYLAELTSMYPDFF